MFDILGEIGYLEEEKMTFQTHHPPWGLVGKPTNTDRRTEGPTNWGTRK